MDLKHRSRGITDGRDRAPSRAMFKAIGFSDSDLQKPLIGVANTWIETMPCNFHLRRLSAKVKEGVRAAGGTPMEFNTIAISDGETMGTEGMRASLVSREIIADSIELLSGSRRVRRPVHGEHYVHGDGIDRAFADGIQWSAGHGFPKR